MPPGGSEPLTFDDYVRKIGMTTPLCTKISRLVDIEHELCFCRDLCLNLKDRGIITDSEYEHYFGDPANL